MLSARHSIGGSNIRAGRYYFSYEASKTQEATDVSDFLTSDEGQGLVEYALIIAVIAIAVIVALYFLRDQITNIFSNIGNNLT